MKNTYSESTRMSHVGNKDQLDPKYVDDPQGNGPMSTLQMGMARGSERLYANIDRLKPGAKSCKFHSHTRQEEFFLILRGGCTLRVGDETHRLKEGDFFCKPAGRGIAHQFINDSADTVEILDVGLNDPDDIIEYPEEGVTLDRRQQKTFKNGSELPGWTSDPNS